MKSLTKELVLLYPLEHSIPAASIATTQKIRFPIRINDRYIRVSFKGTGTLTNSSLGAIAQLGVN